MTNYESLVLLGLVELDFILILIYFDPLYHGSLIAHEITIWWEYLLFFLQGDLTVNVSWAFSPINSPAPRPKITAAIVMLRRERSICVWETESLGVDQFM